MMWLSWLLFAASLVLQIFVVNSLRRGAYKDYPLVFAYSLVLFFTTLADGVLFAGLVPLSYASKSVYFYRNDAVRQFMLFAVVISLIDRALEAYQYRARVRIFLSLAVLASVLFSLKIHSSGSNQFIPRMTEVTRDLSVASAVLTLLLWLMLISSRKKDHLLLMVTGGLGLQFTGEAIAQSLRQMSYPYHHGALIVGNLLAGGVQLLRLYVWLEAFRRSRPAQEQEKEEPDRKTQEAFPRPARTLFETNG
jgi:hypothetical protein